jgi:mRNA-degrading endonuclease RelE of RelBE toxin-antitoxin system
MTWRVTVSRSARKELDRFPRRDQEWLAEALAAMRNDPLAGDVKHLRNYSPAFRRRVGSNRILFDLYPEERQVQVQAIERPSGQTYRRR